MGRKFITWQQQKVNQIFLDITMAIQNMLVDKYCALIYLTHFAMEKVSSTGRLDH